MHIQSITDLESLARSFVSSLTSHPTKARIVALSGELGSGKTTFTSFAANALGITDAVISPTFIIERDYYLPEGSPFKRLIHIDAYRLNGREELEILEWKEKTADPHNLIFIEWPENVAGALPDDHIKIIFEHTDTDTERKIEVIHSHAERKENN